MADRPAPTPADRLQRANSWAGTVIAVLLAASVASLAGTPGMDVVARALMLLAALASAAAHYQVWMVQRTVRAAEVEDAVYRVLRAAVKDDGKTR